MGIAFRPDHLAVFQSTNDNPQWAASRKPRSWAASVGAEETVYSALPDEHVDRDYLSRICADRTLSPEFCFLAIMAWGGMKVDHGRRAWKVRNAWNGIIEALRTGALSRRDAYDEFHQFRRKNPGCGMGPAYYTKLIFFCGPSHDGYIMDQWTSLSINLLADSGESPLVSMSSGAYRGRRWDRVADHNTAETYETFCLAIEGLGAELGIAPDAVEQRLFSQGGRNREGKWRSYVKSNRPPFLRR